MWCVQRCDLNHSLGRNLRGYSTMGPGWPTIRFEKAFCNLLALMAEGELRLADPEAIAEVRE